MQVSTGGTRPLHTIKSREQKDSLPDFSTQSYIYIYISMFRYLLLSSNPTSLSFVEGRRSKAQSYGYLRFHLLKLHCVSLEPFLWAPTGCRCRNRTARGRQSMLPSPAGTWPPFSFALPCAALLLVACCLFLLICRLPAPLHIFQ